MADSPDDGVHTWLLGQPPTAAHRWAAVGLIAVMLAGFAVVAPVAHLPLVHLTILFPLLDAIVFVSDLVTAVLLFAQYAISRVRALYWLACGYLFTAFIVVPHALTIAGAFAPTGLLGANIQTGSWLFIFWHLGFAVSLLAYALLRRQPPAGGETPVAPQIGVAIAALLGLVCALTWLATAGVDLLPRIITDQRTLGPFVIYPIWLTILVTAAALAALWRRPRSVLDLWLMVVALAFILELVFSGLLPTVRFSAGFYAGRVFSLVTTSVVLIILLGETTRLYAELARSNAVLRRERNNKLMNLEAMAAAIAHEVRQPLSGISSFAGAALRFMQREPPDMERASRAVASAIDATRNANEVLENVRGLFGRRELPTARIDVNGVVLDVLRTLDRELREAGVQARPSLAADLPPVRGHKGQLQEVVFNLVHNAVEAMQSVAGRRVLRIETGHDAGLVEVTIADTGPGIGADRAETIFEPFVTTKSQGMGLGLAICRKIVERHGGTLTAARGHGQGATFHVRLPREAAEDPAPRRAVAEAVAP